MGRRAQPRGHRRAGAPRARAAAAPARCLPARRAARRIRPPRVAGKADQPAARRGGPAQAPHAGRDGARRHAHPGDRPAGAARGRPAPCTSARTASPSISRSCSPRWTTRPGQTVARSAPRRCRTRSRTRCSRASGACRTTRARSPGRGPSSVAASCPRSSPAAWTVRSPTSRRPLAELVEQSFLYPFDFLDRGFYDFRHQLLRDALYAHRGAVRAAPPPRPRGRVRIAAGRLVGDPRVRALRAGRPARAGLPDGAGRGARRECRLESARGVRALPARRGERARRAPG